MGYALDRVMVICLGVLVLACLVASGTAVASIVVHRSTRLAKEIATRRILGARRSHIVGMFLLESVSVILVGILVGGIVLLIAGALFDLRGWVSLLYSSSLLTCAGLLAGWIAARHAAKTPFSKSGLFSSSPDKRGE